MRLRNQTFLKPAYFEKGEKRFTNYYSVNHHCRLWWERKGEHFLKLQIWLLERWIKKSCGWNTS